MALLLQISKHAGELIDQLRTEGFREEIRPKAVSFEKGDKVPGRLMVEIGGKKVFFYVQTGEKPWEIKQVHQYFIARDKEQILEWFRLFKTVTVEDGKVIYNNPKLSNC